MVWPGSCHDAKLRDWQNSNRIQQQPALSVTQYPQTRVAATLQSPQIIIADYAMNSGPAYSCPAYNNVQRAPVACSPHKLYHAPTVPSLHSRTVPSLCILHMCATAHTVEHHFISTAESSRTKTTCRSHQRSVIAIAFHQLYKIKSCTPK